MSTKSRHLVNALSCIDNSFQLENDLLAPRLTQFCYSTVENTRLWPNDRTLSRVIFLVCDFYLNAISLLSVSHKSKIEGKLSNR